MTPSHPAESVVVGHHHGIDILRTPDHCFADLPDFPFAPHYLESDGLRLHYVDEGPAEGATVLMLHGQPTWSFLYRKMIPPIAAAGYRTIAPDLIGFGRSDKLADPEAYSYARHVAWVWDAIEQLGLEEITLVCQDWGSLIGLRLVGEHPERFARVVVANGALPTGDHPPNEAFMRWLAFSQRVPTLPIGRIVQGGSTSTLSEEVVAGYEAPYPDERSKAGARRFPVLVPIGPDDPASEANRRAWEGLRGYDRPFLTAFGDNDPLLGDQYAVFQRLVPGAQGQPHLIVEGAGHFIQEDQGKVLARIVLDFIASTP